MKKYINKLFAVVALATATITSCTVEEGTVPGNDKDPNVVVYSYTAQKPYNEDNDVALRLAFNNQVESAYYLAEKASEKESRLSSLGEEGYMDYVVSNGTKIGDVTSNTDITLTDMYGKYAITIVVVNGTKKTFAATEFTGLEWADVVTGTYHFAVNTSVTGESRPTTLQVCTTDNTLYRLKDVFGQGSNMKFQLLPDYTAKDADGNDIEKMIDALEKVKDIHHPIVVHIKTLKGKGLDIAEANKEAFHWMLAGTLSWFLAKSNSLLTIAISISLVHGAQCPQYVHWPSNECFGAFLKTLA